jgi:hypothetical protein
MALTARDYMARIGRTPEQQRYFDASGNVNSNYSSVPSQQNPKPIYSYTPKTSKRGGGFTYGNTVNVYKKDTPVAAAPAETQADNTQTESSVPDFIKKYVTSGSTTHAGLTAIQEAMKQGMSINDIRNASRDQGFTIASGAAQYLDQQQSNTTATALPDFLRTYVAPEYYQGAGTRAGLTAVKKAQAEGMSINDILRASVAQGFQFASGAQAYLDNARAPAAPAVPTNQPDYQSQLAALASQQESYLNNLRIEQDNRLNKMAAEQKAAAEALALGQRTSLINQARSGQMGALQIGGASQTPRTGGTQGFKRRKLQINPATSNALEGILGTAKAATTTNTLNV